MDGLLWRNWHAACARISECICICLYLCYLTREFPASEDGLTVGCDREGAVKLPMSAGCPCR